MALFRLNPIKTKKRSPGPGPFRSGDWKHIAERMLKNRQIILHTDGARSYKLALPGVPRQCRAQEEESASTRQNYVDQTSLHEGLLSQASRWKSLEGESRNADRGSLLGPSTVLCETYTPQSRVGLACSKGACCPVDLLAQTPEFVGSHWRHVAHRLAA